jgi:hypothetical protein
VFGHGDHGQLLLWVGSSEKKEIIHENSGQAGGQNRSGGSERVEEEDVAYAGMIIGAKKKESFCTTDRPTHRMDRDAVSQGYSWRVNLHFRGQQQQVNIIGTGFKTFRDEPSGEEDNTRANAILFEMD